MITHSESTAEIYWMAFRGLPRDEQRLVIQHLIKDENLRRDLMDLALIEERRNEPARPLREYLKKSASKK